MVLPGAGRLRRSPDLSVHIEQAINSALELDFLGRPDRKLSQESPSSRISTSHALPLLPSHGLTPWQSPQASPARQPSLFNFIKPETVGKSGGRGGPLGDEGRQPAYIIGAGSGNVAGLDSRGLHQAVGASGPSTGQSWSSIKTRNLRRPASDQALDPTIGSPSLQPQP